MDQSEPADEDGGWGEEQRARPALRPREAAILRIIEAETAATGVAPARRTIAAAANIRPVPTLEPFLVRLARKGYIELPDRAQRAIRIIDHGAAPIIRCMSTVDPGTPLVSDERTVDQAPSTLAARLGGNIDYLISMHDESLDAIGVKPGDLVAMRSTIAMGRGNVMAARDERGTMRWYRTAMSGHNAITFRRVDSRRGNPSPHATLHQADGTVGGVIRIRARQAKTATEPTESTPTRKQGAVLAIMRRYVRVRQMPASLGEIARELQDGTTSASVYSHVKALERKGLARRTGSKQRSWRPTETGTVPIVDIEQWLRSAERSESEETVKEQTPDTLAQAFRPRPDVFLTPSQEIAQRLGLKTTDLVAVTATTEPDEGDMVIARVGERGEIACGELRWRDGGIAELRPATGNDAVAPIIVETASEDWTIAGIITGTVTFAPGTPGD